MDACADDCNEDGSCKGPICPATCKGDCDGEGKCKCDEACPSDCNEDGSCKDPQQCPATCKGDCNDDGSCKGKCEDGCSKCDGTGKCIDKEDTNGNNMFDGEETGPNWGKSCRTHTVCDSTPGAEDGFCDSFIGYKCSTRCNEDKQCSKENYVCRSDGRCTPNVFETVWKVEEGDTIIEFYTNKEVCNYSIDWGDGEKELVTDCEMISGSHYHEYENAGDCHVKIIGDYHGWMCGYCYKLTEVVSFGSVVFNYESVFNDAINLKKVSQIDIPNASDLNLRFMFNSCKAFNDDINDWDVSQVIDMTYTFNNARQFNQPLGRWDTSKVNTMKGMFNGAVNFGPKNADSGINNWNVSNVKDMSEMFYNASVFNNPLNDWNVSSVKDMSEMFYEATLFNSPLDNWNVSSVEKMINMFGYAKNFNSPLNTWNIANCTDLYAMFSNASLFNQKLNNWNTSNVTDFSKMFEGAKSFNQDLSDWKIKEDASVGSIFSESGMNSNYDGKNYYICEMIKKDAWKRFASDLDQLGISITCK